MKIIAISGYAGSGKSSFQKSLIKILEHNDYSVASIGFADKPKALYAELMGKSVEELFENSVEKNKNRANFVAFAEGLKDIFGKNVWADNLVKSLSLYEMYDFVIIPDL